MAKQARTPVQFPVISTPSNPPSGSVLVYSKSDTHVYSLNSSGTETDLSSAGSSGASPARAFFLS